MSCVTRRVLSFTILSNRLMVLYNSIVLYIFQQIKEAVSRDSIPINMAIQSALNGSHLNKTKHTAAIDIIVAMIERHIQILIFIVSVVCANIQKEKRGQFTSSTSSEVLGKPNNLKRVNAHAERRELSTSVLDCFF